MSSTLQTFQEILSAKGLIPSEIIADGKLHRCPTQAKPHKQNGAYIAHLDTPATLWWCNWENGQQDTFTEAEERTPSPAEKTALQQRHAAMKQQREAEFAQRQATAAQTAQNELNAASPCSPDHLYLRRKGVPALADIRQSKKGTLLIPVRDSSSNVQSVQYISPEGEKRFLVGGKISGGHFVILGKPEKPLIICEGYATGASIHLAYGMHGICGIFWQSICPHVAGIVRRKHLQTNPSSYVPTMTKRAAAKGQEAAQAAQARLVLPSFTTGNGNGLQRLAPERGATGSPPPVGSI